MTTTVEKEFNVYDYVKTLVVRAELAKSDEIRMRQTNSNVLNWLVSVNAIKSYETSYSDTNIDEDGKRYVKVTLKGINLKAKAKSKEGKEFSVFSPQIIGREYLRTL